MDGDSTFSPVLVKASFHPLLPVLLESSAIILFPLARGASYKSLGVIVLNDRGGSLKTFSSSIVKKKLLVAFPNGLGRLPLPIDRVKAMRPFS